MNNEEGLRFTGKFYYSKHDQMFRWWIEDQNGFIWRQGFEHYRSVAKDNANWSEYRYNRAYEGKTPQVLFAEFMTNGGFDVITYPPPSDEEYYEYNTRKLANLTQEALTNDIPSC